eukprot:6188222-Pleurochrysis_carterae.AAC.3
MPKHTVHSRFLALLPPRVTPPHLQYLNSSLVQHDSRLRIPCPANGAGRPVHAAMRELFVAQALLLRSGQGYQKHDGYATAAASSVFEPHVVCPPSVCSTACGGKYDGVLIPPSHCAFCSDQRTDDYDWLSKSNDYCTLYECDECKDGQPVLFPTEFSFSDAHKKAGKEGKKVPFAFVSSGGGDRASAASFGLWIQDRASASPRSA